MSGNFAARWDLALHHSAEGHTNDWKPQYDCDPTRNTKKEIRIKICEQDACSPQAW